MATCEKPSYLGFAESHRGPKQMPGPIDGYEDMELVSLEEAIKSLVDLVPDVKKNVTFIKRICKQPEDGLTVEESASIMLFTYESYPGKKSLGMKLNEALRSEERKRLQPWFSYLRLIISALIKLPTKMGIVLHEVPDDLSKSYSEGQTIIWWHFSTCTNLLDRLSQEGFFKRTDPRTLFHIGCLNGKDITNHSMKNEPNQILLLPGRQFQVEGQLNSRNGVCIIYLTETEPNVPIIEMPSDIPSLTSPFASLKLPSKPEKKSRLPKIPSNAAWSENATTIITGLSHPQGLALDLDYGTIYVTDWSNKRIISWNPITNETNVIVSNLGGPTDVLIDKETNSIIIADYNNKRVLRCSLENGKNQVDTILDKIGCWGLAMDNEGSLYVSDYDKHEVSKFLRGEKTGILVAGGNGQGNGKHQLDCPSYIALDDEGSLYVSDWNNHRVMQWKREAKQGITVAGDNGYGSNNNQLNYPFGIVVDSNGNIYVAEEGNNDRVTRWRKGEKTGEILVGGKGEGNGMNQFNCPMGLYFDRENNLYVADRNNNRVQRFSMK